MWTGSVRRVGSEVGLSQGGILSPLLLIRNFFKTFSGRSDQQNLVDWFEIYFR